MFDAIALHDDTTLVFSRHTAVCCCCCVWCCALSPARCLLPPSIPLTLVASSSHLAWRYCLFGRRHDGTQPSPGSVDSTTMVLCRRAICREQSSASWREQSPSTLRPSCWELQSSGEGIIFCRIVSVGFVVGVAGGGF